MEGLPWTAPIGLQERASVGDVVIIEDQIERLLHSTIETGLEGPEADSLSAYRHLKLAGLADAWVSITRLHAASPLRAYGEVIYANLALASGRYRSLTEAAYAIDRLPHPVSAYMGSPNLSKAALPARSQELGFSGRISYVKQSAELTFELLRELQERLQDRCLGAVVHDSPHPTSEFQERVWIGEVLIIEGQLERLLHTTLAFALGSTGISAMSGHASLKIAGVGNEWVRLMRHHSDLGIRDQAELIYANLATVGGPYWSLTQALRRTPQSTMVASRYTQSPRLEAATLPPAPKQHSFAANLAYVREASAITGKLLDELYQALRRRAGFAD